MAIASGRSHSRAEKRERTGGKEGSGWRGEPITTINISDSRASSFLHLFLRTQDKSSETVSSLLRRFWLMALPLPSFPMVIVATTADHHTSSTIPHKTSKACVRLRGTSCGDGSYSHFDGIRWRQGANSVLTVDLHIHTLISSASLLAAYNRLLAHLAAAK